VTIYKRGQEKGVRDPGTTEKTQLGLVGKAKKKGKISQNSEKKRSLTGEKERQMNDREHKNSATAHSTV